MAVKAGQNIAEKTNQGVTGWGANMKSGDWTINEAVEGGIRYVKIIRGQQEHADGDWGYLYFENIGRSKYEANTNYTISFDVRPSVATKFVINLWNFGAQNTLLTRKQAFTQNLTGGEWNHVDLTVTTTDPLPEATDQVLYFGQMDLGIGTTYEFKNLKIELGDYSTAWTPAPEDEGDHKMAVKASNQLTVLDLTDGYSVILTNESHTFIGDTDSVAGTQTTNCSIQALQGADQVPCKIGTITAPTGLSIVSDGKSPIPTLTITATSALTDGGVVKIPVIVNDDITIEKAFSYAIAYTGQKGATGESGKGIKGTPVTTYQGSTSGTSIPSGTWTASIPSVQAGQFLWTRTVTTYTDNTTSTAYSVSMMGATGATGGAGKGIKGTPVVQYQVGTSGTEAPTGTWSNTPVATTQAGQFLWTRTITTYTDNTTSTSYSISAHGAKGDKGDKGNKGDNGEDALTLVIISSNGSIFKNTDIATTLTAHVYKGAVEVTGTALASLGTIRWYKDQGTTAVATGQSYTISAGDVENRATFTAQLEA